MRRTQNEPAGAGKKLWTIPVCFEMCGKVIVRADSLEEAMDTALTDESIALPEEKEYIEGSWQLSLDDADAVRSLYNDNQSDVGPEDCPVCGAALIPDGDEEDGYGELHINWNCPRCHSTGKAIYDEQDGNRFLRHEIDDSGRYIDVEYEKLMMEAADAGLILSLDKDIFIDDLHLDCVWYGGYLGSILSPDRKYEIIIEVHGDVRISGTRNGEEFYYRDKNNDGAWMASDETLKELFASDAELDAAYKNDEVSYGNNNWIEFFVYGPNRELIQDGTVLDSTDNVLEAFSGLHAWRDVLRDAVKSWHEEKRKELKEEKCLHCDCYDPDRGCSMPAADLSYACPKSDCLLSLPASDVEFLSSLKQELLTQSSDGNAEPVYWMIRESYRQFFVAEEESHGWGVFYEEDRVSEYDDIQSVYERIVEDLTENNLPIEGNLDPIEDYGEDILALLLDANRAFHAYKERYQLCYYRDETRMVPGPLFLTKKDCEDHIAKFSHNYHCPQPYALTAERSPVVTRLLALIKSNDWS